MGQKITATFSDNELENIYECIGHSIAESDVDIMDEMASRNRPEYIKFYRAHINSLRTLRDKIIYNREFVNE